MKVYHQEKSINKFQLQNYNGIWTPQIRMSSRKTPAKKETKMRALCKRATSKKALCRQLSWHIRCWYHPFHHESSTPSIRNCQTKRRFIQVYRRWEKRSILEKARERKGIKQLLRRFEGSPWENDRSCWQENWYGWYHEPSMGNIWWCTNSWRNKGRILT